jgi:hypothetical protein
MYLFLSSFLLGIFIEKCNRIPGFKKGEGNLFIDKNYKI